MLGLTLDDRCRARAVQHSAAQRSPVADSDTDPYSGSVLFVCVLCASAVRVGVCGVCESIAYSPHMGGVGVYDI